MDEKRKREKNPKALLPHIHSLIKHNEGRFTSAYVVALSGQLLSLVSHPGHSPR